MPQALEGVATVGLVYLTVRRWFTAQAALLAGAVVALTPVAAMMFRFNNPDALLALLLTGATYATVRALERAQTRWLVLAGALVGFGFITKMMQAFLILPVLGIVYLLAAPTAWWRRGLAGRRPGRLHAGGGGMVGGRRGTDPGRRPSLRRRLAEQQHLQPDLRLQRLRPVDRQRGRHVGGRESGAACGARPGSPGSSIPVRQHDVLAAARRARDGRRRSGLHPPGQADRPRAGRLLAVGRLSGRHRADHQPGPGHHPPVLHGRSGATAGRTGRHGHHRLWQRRASWVGRAGWPRRWPPPCGASCCSTARPTGSRGSGPSSPWSGALGALAILALPCCAGSPSWPSAWWPPWAWAPR